MRSGAGPALPVGTPQNRGWAPMGIEGQVRGCGGLGVAVRLGMGAGSRGQALAGCWAPSCDAAGAALDPLPGHRSCISPGHAGTAPNAEPCVPKHQAPCPQGPSSMSPSMDGAERLRTVRPQAPSPQAWSPASLSPVTPKLRVPKPQTPCPQAWCPQAPSQVPGASLLPSNPASLATTPAHPGQGTAQSGVTPLWPSARGGHGVRGPLGCHPETPSSPLPKPWGRYSPGRRAAVGACCTLTGAREERERSV